MKRFLAFAIALIILATTASAYAYRYFSREDLARDLAKVVGQKVKVVDEVEEIWDYQEVDGYLRFDTVYFRCIISKKHTESIALLRNIHSRKDKKKIVKKIIAVYGTVERPEFWGEVKGKEEGVCSEEIVIVVDKVEIPRKRYFKEMD